MESGSDYVDSDDNASSVASSLDPRDLVTSSPQRDLRQPEHEQEHQPSSSLDPRGDVSEPATQAQAKTLSAHSSTTSLVVPFPQDNPFAHGADAKTYFSRPNRYFGPPATWKSWTETERSLAKGIDRARAQDLSLHLFNSFVLRRRLRQVRDRQRAKRKGKGRPDDEDPREAGSYDDSDDDENAQDSRSGKQVSQPYSIPRSWTAWPMPANEVPRDELLPRVGDAGEFRAKPDMRPSSALEACLVSTATRIARERWNARSWETPDLGMEVGVKQQPSGMFETEEQDPRESEMMALEQGASDLDDPNDEDDEDEDLEYPVFASQPYPASNDGDESVKSGVLKGEPSDNEVDEYDRQPVPLADDDQARELFLPNARHILAKIDDLLIGLHKARYAYAGKPLGKPRGRSASTSRSRPESAPGSKTSRGRSRSQKAPSSSQQRREESVGTDVSMTSLGRISTPREKKDLDRRLKGLGLRDWSDVVGMAALTGWDPAVVERASERCAKLFDENMLFRTFYEGEERKGPQREGSYYTEQLAADNDEDESDGPENGETSTSAVRTSAPCEQCWFLRIQCNPRADDQSGLARPCDICINRGLQCSGITVAQKHEDWQQEIVCPHNSCERHSIPFRKPYHLQRHLNSMHRNDRAARARDSRVSSTSLATSDTDIDVFYHNTSAPIIGGRDAEIICPVPECRRHHQPFSRGTKLYTHLRKMHPEVDVDEVKRLETLRRGERRGRPGHRSRSASVSVTAKRKRGREKNLEQDANSEDLA